jgi:cytochrome c
MSELTFNKIAGAVLATALAVVGLEELSSIVYQAEPAKKPGYDVPIVVETAGGAAAAPEAPPDWGTVLPTADVAAGQAATAPCQTCHNFANGGPNMTGPNLYGVVGRKPGTHPGFAYSSGMTAEGDKLGAWSYDDLNTFLSGPQAYVAGTKMTFVGLKKQDTRINVIAYLRTLSPSPAPIPPPNPKAAAPAAGAPAAAAPAGAAPASAKAPSTDAPASTASSAPAAASSAAPAAAAKP